MSATLQGKVIVVSGASSGYGLAASCEFLRLGATVIMAARHISSAEVHAADDVTGKAIMVEADVRDRTAVQSLKDRAVSEFGRLDVWVNSASTGTVGHFTSLSLDAHVEVIETDLLGTLYGCSTAIEQFLLQQTGGVLINVAADPDSLSLPYMSSYAASKYGVVGLSAALRAEAKAQGWKNIHICTVMPGDQAKLRAEEVPDEGQIRTSPLVQAAVLDDTADAIVSLASSPRDSVRVGGTHYFL